MLAVKADYSDRVFWAAMRVMQDLPRELADRLDEAHMQYLELHEIADGAFSPSELEAERASFAHCLSPARADGEAAIDDDKCAAYMSAKLGVPLLLCELFLTYELLELQLQGLVRWGGEHGELVEGVGRLPAQVVDLLQRRRTDLMLLEEWFVQQGLVHSGGRVR